MWWFSHQNFWRESAWNPLKYYISSMMVKKTYFFVGKVSQICWNLTFVAWWPRVCVKKNCTDTLRYYVSNFEDIHSIQIKMCILRAFSSFQISKVSFSNLISIEIVKKKQKIFIFKISHFFFKIKWVRDCLIFMGGIR